ncbi:hypothetical protein HKD37_19G053388 [Glycine soja]
MKARGHSGGIWILSNRNDVNFDLVNSYPQPITFDIKKMNASWRCTVVYASPIPSIRASLLDHLLHLHQSFSIPWAIQGDMNEILLASEVMGSSFSYNRVVVLANFMSDCGLIDLDILGGVFTWHRHTSNGVHIHKRLDRCMTWNNVLGNAIVKLGKITEESNYFNKETFGNIFRHKCHLEARLRGVHRVLDT